MLFLLVTSLYSVSLMVFSPTSPMFFWSATVWASSAALISGEDFDLRLPGSVHPGLAGDEPYVPAGLTGGTTLSDDGYVAGLNILQADTRAKIREARSEVAAAARDPLRCQNGIGERSAPRRGLGV